MDKSHNQPIDSNKEKGLYFCEICALVRVSSLQPPRKGLARYKPQTFPESCPEGRAWPASHRDHPKGGLAPASHPAAVPGGYRDPLATAPAAATCAGPVSVGLQRGNAARAQLSPGKVNTGVQGNTQLLTQAPQGRLGTLLSSQRIRARL